MRTVWLAGASAVGLLCGAAGGTPARADVTDAESARGSTTVDELVVTSRAQRLYRAEITTVGKIDADPLDIPQAVQILNSQLIEDQGARDVTDLYRNISGLSFFSYAGVTFRGFRQDGSGTYYDGLRGDPFIAFSVPQLFNIERVEVLKGPAGMLYGPASPGGTINYVTKTPGETFGGQVRLTAGNYDRLGAAVEVTGPLVDRLSGRVGLFYEERDSFRKNARSENFIGDAGLTFRAGEDLALTVAYTAYDQDLPGNRLRGVQVDRAGNFLTSITWNHNEPSDYLKSSAEVYRAKLVWDPDGPMRGDFQVRHFDAKEAQEYHEQRDLLDTDGNGVPDTITREFRDQRRASDGLAFGGNFATDVATGAVNHRILLGGDWYEENSESLGRTAVDPTRGGPVPNLSILNPVYGRTSGANYNLAARAYTRSASASRRAGVYIQDQMMIAERFILVGGVRYDSFNDRNRVNGVRYKDDDLTWRAGAVFKPRPDVSVYASWSNTFEPQGAASQDAVVGGPFAPVTGEQLEGGVKTALFGGRLQTGAAIYRIVRENILQTDTTRPPVNGRDQLAPIGEVTSKGFEFDLAADITPAWVLTLNYGYNDTRVTGTVPGQAITNAVGDRFVNAPKHKLGFWTRYQVESIRTAFAFGGEYVSERVGFDGQRVKPYTVFDASIIKTLDFAEVMLRVDNIFDETYAASGFSLRNGSFPGEPRTWFVEVRRKF
ncbi:TonB-dependent siderophore receptor [Phenylobacterium sp. SCN 70-31]|uniref:TonB-dependent siderophore receptor n=1 Tax=Phenylobacterium sp. SCN 70-31 TaxID=1660129 RepID=UPI00086C2CFE|nr:TonB-dependent siderophore receptor [Phenylobacterium sp. SCN 70-31]ODT85285.1 MAG: TonB-dependent receptor [Phenylobacterium sp. SCN 70-31]